jgi:ribose 1,5-bisphosphokinase PhnN
LASTLTASSFLTANRDARFESKERAREYHRFASIPVVVVEQWLKEGFDVYKESPKAILKRLREQNLEAFITSNKSL